MKIIFLTIGKIRNIEDHGIYSDLLRYFRDKGHDVCIVCQNERREGEKTHLETVGNMRILYVRTGNITKTNIIEKGISTLLIGQEYRNAINKYFGDESFDIILYSTITLASVVRYMKRRDNAFTYLMLKDIFPQNAVDLGMMKKSGLGGLLYRYFRRKESQLYSCSDKIGCMSPANARFVLKHNKDISKDKIEICPNTVDEIPLEAMDKDSLRERYDLPKAKIIFTYGGNFGKPQGVEFILQVLDKARRLDTVHFVMCGSGTEFHKIKEYKTSAKAENLTVIEGLPNNEYRSLLRASDVALIFLDYRFTIPNFPSRLLDYMNLGMPVLAATDINTDLGKLIMEQDFGWWCESNDVDKYMDLVRTVIEEALVYAEKGMNGKRYMSEHFTSGKAYQRIINAYEAWKGGRKNVRE